MEEAKFAHLGNILNRLTEPYSSRHPNNGQHPEPVKRISHFRFLLL